MPGRNRTGPMGNGPLTGRATGGCTGSGMDVGSDRPFRRSGGNFHFDDGAWCGWTRSRMRGCRRFPVGTDAIRAVSPYDENGAQPSDAQAGFLLSRLDKIEKRLDDLARRLTDNG